MTITFEKDKTFNQFKKYNNSFYIYDKNFKFPFNISCLSVIKGYDKQIRNDEFPNFVNQLLLGELKYPLLKGSISKNINTLYLDDQFNQFLKPGSTIPDSITTLHIGSINSKLLIGSIPNSVTKLYLHDGFNQIITKNLIPSSVIDLYLYDIKQPLEIDGSSIPDTVLSLNLCNGFNQLITNETLNNTTSNLTNLCLEDIKTEFDNLFISKSIRNIEFKSGFSKLITSNNLINRSSLNGIVTVTSLVFNDIKVPLIIGSIPNSIHSLTLDQYNFPIDEPGIIPSKLNKLIIGNLKYPLNGFTIPENLVEIYFKYGYNHPVPPNLLPSKLCVLKIRCDLSKNPLVVGSIPPSIRCLDIHHNFQQPLDNLISNDVIINRSYYS